MPRFRAPRRQPADAAHDIRARAEKRAPGEQAVDAAHEIRSAIDRRIVTRAARTEGVLTARALLEAGLSHDGIAHRVAHGWLIRRYHGVFLVGPVAGTLAEEMAAVQAIGEDSGLSHDAAGALWRIRATVAGPIDVSVAGRHARSRAGIRVHNVRTLELTTHRGIPVTTPARTLLDLAATVGADDLARAVEQARVLRLTSDTDLRALLAAHPRAAGTRALRRVLDVDPRMTRSEAERLLLELIRRAGLPQPETNVRVLGREVDALWRKGRLIVEVDGFDAHGTRMAFERDRRRDAELVAAGYRVIRITWRQLIGEPEAVLARLAGALAQR
jgi:very-short-patch-repair endonuclease/predicted transcriptional regulator of viral defense system